MSRRVKSCGRRALWCGRGGAVHPAALFVFALLLASPFGPLEITQPAEAGGTRIELREKRTQTSKTFRNPNGTYTTSLSSEPVHYQHGGAWKEISSRVVPVTATPGYAWRNEANDFSVRFKDTAAEDYLQLQRSGKPVTFTLEGAADSKAAITGSSISYKRVFPGVDLRYDVTATGVKETLILGDAEAPLKYRFVIDGPDRVKLSAKPLESGGWIVNSPQTPRLFELAPPTLEESTRKLGGHRARRSAVQMDVAPEDGRLAIDLTVDRAWLENPERKFPVLLDPTITIKPPTKEGNFDALCGTCTALGSPLWIGTTDYEAWRAALQFNLNAIPPAAQINSASLGLYHDATDCVYTTSGVCGESSHTLTVHRMNTAWNDFSTTSSGLGWDAAALASYTLPASAASGWMSWDVKTQLQNWVSGTQPNYGFLVKRSTEPLDIGGPSVPGIYAYPASRVPKLDVTYTSDAVKLFKPETLHSNGADLRWSAYAYPDGHSFQSYEVHRSSNASFTPSASTRVATIGDVAVTSYRDTTAAPSKTFTYKLLTNGWSSHGQTVTLPADGQASKTLQLTPSASATYLESVTGTENCMNYGGDEYMMIGADTDGDTPPWVSLYRPLVHFDLRDIPTGATVTSANLQLYADLLPPARTVTINVHRATAAWKEGTGWAECSGDGATWEETEGGIAWTSRGGDFDPTVVASKTRTATQTNPAWDTYSVTSAVQRWVSGQAPNHGLLLKFGDETPDVGHWFAYNSDEHWTSAQRPKLALTYADGSHAQGPTVAVSEPAPSALVSGSAAPITAAASDDGRVDLVEFLVDGVVKATDTTAPFTGSWNSTAVAGGAHTISVRATDDAGNVTTSAGVPVTVENSALPTTSVTAPANGATVSGTVNVTANASGGQPISRVEFLFDGLRYAEDAAAPYSASWSTLDPNQTAYDGAHVLTTKAYDSAGREVTSANVNVTVANTAGTRYDAAITSSEEPLEVEFDPDAGVQEDYTVDLSIKNESGANWTGSDLELHYRWYSADETPVVTDGPAVPLGADLAPGQTRALTVTVAPPSLPYGVDQAQYRLQFDLWDKAGQCWFSRKGNRPKENPVTVNKKLMQALGIEPYYQYVSEELGAGMQHQVNVANGNSIVQWTPFSAPGRGLDTVLTLTYNSLEQKSSSPIGDNWSLAISSLTRFGSQLDVHPNESDDDDDDEGKWIALTDADGTTHKFSGKTAADGKTYYEEPAGTHLYLRQFSTTDMTRKWALTTPDRVTFFYDSRGYPTSVEDRNGNRLTFTLGPIPNSGDDDEDEDDDGDDDEDGQRKRITEVIDAGGRKFTLTYFSKRDAWKRHLRGKVKRITDHSGSPLDFEYYQDGNLLRIIQRGATNADGTYLPDRSFVFTYTTSSGSGPAIPLAANRVNPNPKTSNQSTRLYSVRDPRGNETTFAYVTSGQNKWKLATRTDRAGAVTSFVYDITNRVTTVTAPLSRVTKYGYDTQGSVTSLTNPLNQVTTQTWSADRMLTKVTEPTGKYVEFAYDANGLMLDRWDQLRSRTSYVYENLPVDAADVAGKWKVGRAIPHMSQLKTETSPRGTATATPTDDFQTTHTYDSRGNRTSTTDPLGYTRSTSYNGDGTAASQTDERGSVTTFAAYDANGFAVDTRDAKGQTTKEGFDADGLRLWAQDPMHAADVGGNPRDYREYFDYDSFHRLGRTSRPKSTRHSRGTLVWSTRAYDPNDNMTREGIGSYAPAEAPATTSVYDAMDRMVASIGPDHSAGEERTEYAYDLAGRLVKTTLPLGVATPAVVNDYATENVYDALDRLTTETRYPRDGSAGSARVTNRCFDLAGDLRSVTEPRGAAAEAPVQFSSCPAASDPSAYAYTPASYTTKFEYYADHSGKSTTDPVGNTSSVTYDVSGNVASSTDAEGNTTTFGYDARNDLTEEQRPFDPARPARKLVARYEYDGSGNLAQEISERAVDSQGSGPYLHYVTTYTYDSVGQVTSIKHPSDGSTRQAWTHFAYDANGEQTSVSLPVDTADPTLVSTNQQTRVDYLDTGWIRTIDNPESRTVTFDYDSQGLPTSRTPFSGAEETWTYYDDGDVKENTDPYGHPNSFTYDLNNNLVRTDDGSGAHEAAEAPLVVERDYNGFDEVVTIRQRKEPPGQTPPAWRVTTYGYDGNGNLEQRSDGGGLQTFGYDQADRMTSQLDANGSGCADDRRLTASYLRNGWTASQSVQRSDGGCDASIWPVKRRTEWTYYSNGDLKTLRSWKGSSTSQNLVESHTLEYEVGGVYINGNRTKDTFTLEGPGAASCRATACAATYSYDARDRVTRWENGLPGGESSTAAYALDAETTAVDTLAGNVTNESVIGAGARSRDYAYTAAGQLKSLSVNGTPTQLYFYDPNTGNIRCVTDAGHTAAMCDGDGSAKPGLRDWYKFDDLDRMTAFKSHRSAAAIDSSYVYDAFDRASTETESHNGGAARTIDFTYLGVSGEVSAETVRGGSTKRFSYDAAEQRVGASIGSDEYSFARNPHGDMSLLVADSGGVTASYAYKPYGDLDATVSRGDVDRTNTLNPFRFNDKRFDSGSRSIDMGARRFDPDDGRFLEQDYLRGAEADLELARASETQNRYAFAGGNPVTFAEEDGHAPLRPDPGTGAAPPRRPPFVCRTRTLGQREKCAYDFMRGRLTRAQSAGVVGNLWWESGQDLNPRQWEFRCTRRQRSWHDSNCGVGIAQWTTEHRKENLLAFAGGSVERAYRYLVQVRFVWRELRTGDGPAAGSAALPRLRRVTGATRRSVNTATERFMLDYEAPSALHANLRARSNRAWLIFQRYRPR